MKIEINQKLVDKITKMKNKSSSEIFEKLNDYELACIYADFFNTPWSERKLSDDLRDKLFLNVVAERCSRFKKNVITQFDENSSENIKVEKSNSMYRENCDRCHQPSNGVTIMSMYNEEVICMSCKDAEKKRSDYKQAVDADNAEIKKGNYNFKGIGMKDREIL